MRNIIFIASVLFFVSCSSENEVFNKPAVFWYNKITKEIAKYDLDSADNSFVSLQSEHKKSPLLPTAMIILAQAHMDNEEYEMANYYYDEYIKKYAYSKNIDYIRYLKIKSKFLSFRYQFRDQKLIAQILEETDKFIKKYPDSTFIVLVNSMRSRLYMALSVFDKEIASLYTKLDKPKASQLYTKRAKNSWQDIDSIKGVSIPWYRYLFE